MTTTDFESSSSRPSPMNALSEDTLRAIREAVRDSAVPEPAPAVASDRAQGDETPKTVSKPAKAKRQKPRNDVLRGFASRVQAKLPAKERLAKELTPRRLAILVILLSVAIRPWFLPTVFVIVAFVVTFIALLLGPDRCRDYGTWVWKRFSQRRPEKAEEVRKGFNARRAAVQKWLDRLPERWVAGVHLPHWQSDERAKAAESAFAHRMTDLARDVEFKAQISRESRQSALE